MFNSSINVYKTEWLDLVFADRNKNYGAYELRSKSSTIMTRALLISSAAFMLACASPLIYSKLFPSSLENTDAAGPTKLIPVSLDHIYDMKKEIPQEKPEPKKAEPVKVKTVANPSNIVVVDKANLPEPPTMDQLKDAVVSDKTQDGVIQPDLVINTDTNNGVGNGTVNTGSETSSGGEIVGIEGVDEYPEFSGGMKAWAKYIQRNLRYPAQAQDEGVQGKVFISFVVERDGSITDVKVLRGIGFGCDEEAAKVIRKSPLWKPGKNKGNTVRVRYNMPITFTMM